MNPSYQDHMESKNQVALTSASATPPAWARSHEIWLMFRPSAAYQWLADLPIVEDRWSAVKRPLFMALLLGCMVSLVVSQRLTLRHVAGGAVNASILLLGQIAALAIVCGRERRSSFPRTIELFFAGYGPWTLWILAFSAVWSFASTSRAFTLAGPGTMVPTAALVTVWSCYINYRFFERVFQRSRARAAWDVGRLFATSCCVCILIFGWGALWSEFTRMLSR
jgi:hypothetical protein